MNLLIRGWAPATVDRIKILITKRCFRGIHFLKKNMRNFLLHLKPLSGIKHLFRYINSDNLFKVWRNFQRKSAIGTADVHGYFVVPGIAEQSLKKNLLRISVGKFLSVYCAAFISAEFCGNFIVKLFIRDIHRKSSQILSFNNFSLWIFNFSLPSAPTWQT